MSTEITKIDPKEYGLEETQVQSIEQAFAPKIAERDGLTEIYQQVITKELTPELCSEAKQIRLKLVKVRTGIAEIHKTQKAFFLAAGRFVDAWKNKETAPVEQMESNLEQIENHFINIEKERIAKLEADRTAQLQQYTDIIPMSLGLMQDDVFNAYLASQKKANEDRIAAEKQAELDRIAQEKAEAAERKRIRLENERLKKEAEERENAIEAERIERQNRNRKRNEELRPYIIFIREYDAMLEMAEPKYQKEFADIKKGAELQWEYDRREVERKRIEAEKAEAERAKLAAELKAKEDAEAKAKAEAARIEQERIAAANKAAKAPDKDKLKAFVQSITLPELPELKSAETKAVAAVVTEKFKAFKVWAEQQIENV